MSSRMEIEEQETILSEKIKEMYKECNESVEKCFASVKYEQNVYLQKIFELSKSLYDVIRNKDLWKAFINCKNSMEPHSEQLEDSDKFFEINYQLSKDIMRFYSHADHFTWKFIEKFKTHDFLYKDIIGMKDANRIEAFRTHLESTYISVKKLEDRIEQFVQFIANADQA